MENKTTPQKILLFLPLLFALNACTHTTQIKTEQKHNKFRNSSSCYTVKNYIQTRNIKVLSLNVEKEISHTTNVAAYKLVASLQNNEKSPGLDKYSALTLYLDETKKIKLKPMGVARNESKKADSYERDPQQGSLTPSKIYSTIITYQEVAEYPIDLKLIELIANAKSCKLTIEGGLFNIEGEFNEDNFKAFKNFLNECG
jgi:hypothetical protein